MSEVTLGGDRLGSGKKQTQELHNYGYNSFNLEQDWKSTMAPGVLYPFLKLVATTHDYFDIDLDSFVRTLPTQGPLFGSFKLQLDLFSVPFRLYQGIIHNNPVDLGMKMAQVYLPKIKFKTIDGPSAPMVEGSNQYNRQVNESSLAKYMGLSGIGHVIMQGPATTGTAARKINAVPFLAYYDIFKCYYSNKQETNAYVITPGAVTDIGIAIEDMIINQDTFAGLRNTTNIGGIKAEEESETYIITGYNTSSNLIPYNVKSMYIRVKYNQNYSKNNTQKQELLENTGIILDIDGVKYNTIYFNILINTYNAVQSWKVTKDNKTELILYIDGDKWTEILSALTTDQYEDTTVKISGTVETITGIEYTASIQLTPFELKNIDEMRNLLLSANTLGQEFVIDNADESTNILPYSTLVAQTTEGINYNAFQMNGLMVKTYQSDLFNNWLDTEWIDGENGISAITAVSTAGGSFTMDSLNLAEKVYELLNRILVSGGTYQDWQEAVYGEGVIRKCETPMYIGGMSAEVMFEEVISSAETNVDGNMAALGSLGGKGTQVGKKGGNNIHVKCEEESYIIGIASLTPRICYSQGNDWDLTDLDTMDDFHKPALDGIGFQDLMVEQFAWWNTVLGPNGTTVEHRDAAGKQTAWINYQTAVDKCFGDFAKPDGAAFMVLNRNYENTFDDSDWTKCWGVKDITTYIDPQKYNYAFAEAKLSSQNFWAQIHCKVTARRKMGAQQIPNL